MISFFSKKCVTRISRVLFRGRSVGVSALIADSPHTYGGNHYSGRGSTESMIKGIGILGALSALVYSNAKLTECSPINHSDETYRIQSILKEIDESYKNCQEKNFIPGMAYGVMLNGRLIQVMTSGFADVEQRRPVTIDTRFRIASMSKSFTAMAIIKLRDDGKLNLDDPAKKYIPALEGIKKPSSDSPDITIRHLLTHSAGFPQDDPWVNFPSRNIYFIFIV